MSHTGTSKSQTSVAAERLAAVRGRIESACRLAGRSADEIALIAVSKMHPAAAVAELSAEGQRDFGENYVKEAIDKIVALSNPDLTWHFIGRIQSNKCADIARHFHWVHSVDRLKIARRLGNAASKLGQTIDVMLQVNIQNEPSKSGVDPAGLPALLDETAEIDGIRVRGLMAIPEPATGRDAQRPPFAALRRLLERAQDTGHPLDCLSMGMSADLEAAILEGATHVRVGTALFGPRDQTPR